MVIFVEMAPREVMLAARNILTEKNARTHREVTNDLTRGQKLKVLGESNTFLQELSWLVIVAI